MGNEQLSESPDHSESKIQNPKLSPLSAHSKFPISNSTLFNSAFAVEHIIQDAGSPGIEELAREVGADFYRDGVLVFRGKYGNADCGLQNSELPEPPAHPKSKIQNPESRYRIPNYSLAIYSERDCGMYDAINRGFARCTGEICAWLNSDEQYLSGTLEKVFRYFQNRPSLDVLLGDALLVDSNLNPICYRRIMVPSWWHTRLDHLHSLSCAMFIKRSALPSPPLDPMWKAISDMILMDYFLTSRKTICACNELLAAYAFTGNNLSVSIGHRERKIWLKDCGWPPSVLRPIAILINRSRRLWHGAYRSFDVKGELFRHNSGGQREDVCGTVTGRWPQVFR